MSDITSKEAADIVEEVLTSLGVEPLCRLVRPFKKGVQAMWVNKRGDRQTLQLDLLKGPETARDFRKRAKKHLLDAHKKRAFHFWGGSACQ